jgi:ribonuclease P protein component
MLLKSHRLNLKTEFSRVIKGKRIETSHFIWYFSPALNEIPRVGISIRTKNFGKAHNRNRARRLTSEALRPYYDLLKKRDLIIMPKSGVLEIPVVHLTEEVKSVLDRD